MSTRREPDVDVVIPAHDEAGIIADAVRSALAQSRPPARVIVVADSCTDDTADVARGAGADVIEVSAGSPAGARNAGITAAGAELVAFLDADDLWRPTWLERASEALARAPGAVLAYGGVVEEDERGEPVRVFRAPALDGDAFEPLLAKNFVTTSAVVCRRDALLAAGLFDTSLFHAEDWDLWLRLAATADLVSVPGLHVRYRRVPGSLSRSADLLVRAREDALLVVERATARRQVSPALARAARAQVLAFSAMRLLSRDMTTAARRDLRVALSQNPRDASLWLMALLSAAPVRVRQSALAARRRWNLARAADPGGRSS